MNKQIHPARRWRAEPGASLSGSAVVPGDKSLSHRAFILGAMAEGETIVRGVAESEDVLRTVDAVRALGSEVERSGAEWRIAGHPWRSPDRPIDCGNSGTSARLLMGAVAGRPVAANFTGDGSLRRRPMERLTKPLRAMGARIDGGDHLPLSIAGGRLKGLRHVSATASAQVKSAILLAGLGAQGPIELVEPMPSRDHTERMLPLFGVEVESGRCAEGRLASLGRERWLRGTEISIAADPSSASFPLVAALLVPGSAVGVPNVLANPLRTGLFETLLEMGADLRFERRRTVCNEPVADLSAGTSRLRGAVVPAERAPSMIDEYPILAIAAAFAEGETAMHGLAELRFKESDRLATLAAGLAVCGVEARIEGDSLIVRGCGGPPPGGAEVETHGDHRIAMAFLVLGLGARVPVTVDRPEMIATSFPGFSPLMRALGARIGAAG